MFSNKFFFGRHNKESLKIAISYSEKITFGRWAVFDLIKIFQIVKCNKELEFMWGTLLWMLLNYFFGDFGTEVEGEIET